MFIFSLLALQFGHTKNDDIAFDLNDVLLMSTVHESAVREVRMKMRQGGGGV